MDKARRSQSSPNLHAHSKQVGALGKTGRSASLGNVKQTASPSTTPLAASKNKAKNKGITQKTIATTEVKGDKKIAEDNKAPTHKASDYKMRHRCEMLYAF